MDMEAELSRMHTSLNTWASPDFSLELHPYLDDPGIVENIKLSDTLWGEGRLPQYFKGRKLWLPPIYRLDDPDTRKNILYQYVMPQAKKSGFNVYCRSYQHKIHKMQIACARGSLYQPTTSKPKQVRLNYDNIVWSYYMRLLYEITIQY